MQTIHDPRSIFILCKKKRLPRRRKGVKIYPYTRFGVKHFLTQRGIDMAMVQKISLVLTCKHMNAKLYLPTGLGHFPRTFPRTFPTEKNANNVVEIEAGMIKQYFSSMQAGLTKQFVVKQKLDW